jgi:hypothetical protein
MQAPTSPISRRLRTLRRRVAAGALATFVAAWLAVAALGKGDSSTAAANAAPSSSGSTGTQGQIDDGGTTSADQSTQADPVVTGQS